MTGEGFIRFQFKLNPPIEFSNDYISQINNYRIILFDEKLIGANEDGIGYGNISVRYPPLSRGCMGVCPFLITATQTGYKRILSRDDFVLAANFDFKNNFIECNGTKQPSSESITHAMFYSLDENIGAVIHIHGSFMWNRLIDKIPTTNPNIEYGTPELAYEIQRLYKESNLKNIRILAMGGHRDGILSFGSTLEEAYNILIQYQK